jgi:hypothetical protein
MHLLFRLRNANAVVEGCVHKIIRAGLQATDGAMQDIDDEEEEADNQFWTQDFFAEGKGDSDYETESVNTGDEGDSDFSKSESSDEDAGSEEEKLMRILKPKKCKDKPPGWKQAAQRRANFRRAMRSKRPPKSAVPRDRTGDDSDGPSSRAGAGSYRLVAICEAQMPHSSSKLWHCPSTSGHFVQELTCMQTV